MSAVAVATMVLALGAFAPVAADGRLSATEELTVTVDEGTNIAVSAAPDGRLVMDLHGILWAIGPEGGRARPLTDPLLEPARPHWSPDGSRIAFQAYADGNFHVWVMNADGSGVRQLTDGPYDDREPRWSPDGSAIAFASDRGGSYDIWTVDVAGGGLTRRTTAQVEEYEPSWSPDGTEIAFVSAEDDGDRIVAVDAAGARRTLVDATGAVLHAPSWAPDGTRVAYTAVAGGESNLMVSGEQVTTGEDVFVFHPEWRSDTELLYTADGHIRVRTLGGGAADIPFTADVPVRIDEYDHKDIVVDDTRSRPVEGIVAPALSPDARHVAFVALNDVWIMRIGQRPRRVTDDGFYESDPAWSPDGNFLAYASDRAGSPDIYVRDLRSGRTRRVSSLAGAEVALAWSPDGRMIAFQDERGATFTLDVSGGGVQQVLDPLFGPGRPTWSRDGGTIALAAVRPYSSRFREGTSQILTVDRDSGAVTYTPPLPQAPHESISTRGDDGPVWSPDGREMAFVVNSVLWVVPVDGAGRPTGDARQVTDEATDAPTWSADGRSLLYLHNGRLRLVSHRGGRPRDVAAPLRWRPRRADGRVVIHAGRLWDGTSENVRHDVDIVVAGDRIVRVEPHRAETHRRARVVDASDQTVVPGLFDMHNHQEYEAKFFGDRQGRLWLSYGITTTQSVGDQVYRAVEDRESLTSGHRVGPRFFATGEPLDGSRVYYNFMRPITSRDQLHREFSRVAALDYDMLKTYVRLKAAWMEEAVDFAHARGLTSQSHYLSPGIYVGQDGTTHLAATQRLGFARTQSVTERTYRDVIDLYAQGRRSVMTTLFSSSLLLADDPGVVDDPRVRTLYPPWEITELETELANARDPDPVEVAFLEREAGALVRLYRAGATVLVGTDSPLDNVAVSTHLNLRALVRYGLTPYEALRTATVLPAASLGLEDDLGTVEPGKVADLVIVDGDPLEDIDDLIDVRATMAAGRLFTPGQLLRPFAGGRSQDPPAPVNHELPRVPDPAANDRLWWHAAGTDAH